jgi:hypothetical protein
MNKTQRLIAFATENYEAGGHWIVETWDAADYNDLMEEVGGDVELAKERLQQQWELTNAQERECAWGAPDEDDGWALASAGLGTDEDYGYAEDVY